MSDSHENGYVNHNFEMHWLRRRSSLRSRAVVESIRGGDTHALRQDLVLIRDKGKLDALDESGFALLHHAVKSNSTEAVRMLIEHGANIETRDSGDQLTPLHVAARYASFNFLPSSKFANKPSLTPE